MIPAPDLDPTTVEASTVITVNGVEMDHADWSYDRDAGAEIPRALSGKDLMAATGTITWAALEDSEQRQRTPWMRTRLPNGLMWPPAEGDTITIDTVRTDSKGKRQQVRKFTGKVESTMGGIRRPLVSKIIDDTDRARREVDLEPMQYAMPRDGRPGNGSAAVQLAAITPAVLALRAAGYLATPTGSDCWLSVAGAGTLWPEPTKGFLATTPFGQGRTSGMPVRSKWGASTLVPYEAGTKTTVPTVVYGMYDKIPIPADQPHWITLDFPSRIDDKKSTDWAARVSIGGGLFGLDVWRAPDRKSVWIDQYGNKSPALVVPAEEDVRCIIRVGHVDGVYTASLRTDVTGATEVQTKIAYGLMPVWGGEDAARILSMQASFGGVGAMQYRIGNNYSWAWFQDWQPGAYFELAPYGPYSSLGMTYATPESKKSALSIVKDAAKSLCALIWFDEFGRFHWADTEALNLKAPVAEFTSDRNLIDLEWADDTTTYRRVDVKWSRPQITGGAQSPNGWATVWQGRGESLSHTETAEEWATPPADEDWIGIDVNDPVGAGFNPPIVDPKTGGVYADNWLTRLNRGEHTIIGGIASEGKTEATAEWAGGYIDTRIERIGRSTIRFEHKTHPPTQNHKVTLKILPGPDPNGRQVAEWWGGENLPILRAWSRTQWGDMTFTGQETGPVGGPIYEHDAGRWVQDMGHATALEWFLRERLTVPYATITNVKIAVDARLQIGDKITLRDPDVTGLHVEGVIYAEHLAGKPGSHEQTVSIWVTLVHVADPTYGDADATYAGRDYATIQTMLAAQTYGQVDAKPVQ